MKITNLSENRFGIETIFHIFIYLIFFLTANQLTIGVFEKYLILLPIYLQPICFTILFVEIFTTLSWLYTVKILKLDFEFFRVTKLSFAKEWILISFLLPITINVVYILFANLKFRISSSVSQETKSLFRFKILSENFYRNFITRNLRLFFSNPFCNIIKEK